MKERHHDIGGLSILSIDASTLSYDRQDQLQFWKAVQTDFPVLSQLAKQIFCVCATSALSERDFSAVGSTITLVHVFALVAEEGRSHSTTALCLASWGINRRICCG